MKHSTPLPAADKKHRAPDAPMPIDRMELIARLDDFLRGQEEAMTAFTTALGQVVGKDHLADQLRLQVVSYQAGPANKYRDGLLEAAWKAVRPPPPHAR